MEPKRISAIMVLAGVLALAHSATAGDLEPAGPPAPTMKRLDEVEPRTAISEADFPLVINQPGSYYLVEDVSFTSTSAYAILIYCDDVTIDLMGYTITGPNSTNYPCVYAVSRTNIVIRNGAFRDFYNGIYLSSARACKAIGVQAISNSNYGIVLSGYGNIVEGCISRGNGYIGIHCGAGGRAAGNVVYQNDGIGINANSGCVITGNAVYENGSDGIVASIQSTVSDNACSGNGNHGIQASSGCIVTGNTACSNGMDGIYTSLGCGVSNNTVYNNSDDGISCSSGCSIVGNTARMNADIGISATTYCLIDQNAAYSNGTNMSYSTGCKEGVNVAP